MGGETAAKRKSMCKGSEARAEHTKDLKRDQWSLSRVCQDRKE